ncbi:MAG: hypothetical protein ACRDN0_16480 [Trebonia sp.]
MSARRNFGSVSGGADLLFLPRRSIQPAQPRKPTGKPTCERFFRTLREGLIQHLPAYKGPDIHSRSERVEDAAFLFVHELEDIIREWTALVFTDRHGECPCRSPEPGCRAS